MLVWRDSGQGIAAGTEMGLFDWEQKEHGNDGANGEYATTPEELRKALHNAWQLASNDSIPSVINCQAKKEFWERSYQFIGNERGMFSFLGLSKAQIVRLREQFHVYMLESSRINIAGINSSNVDTVVDSIAEVLDS